ncbi:SDR family NAD(P)-dependent oxidoreductase [Zoogloea sp.]|uniref:SDR family NAD(P)-dependent oxidoreductase n=1 Tax=Zoogloea sp. TaxID=49181 RepID=UPI00260BF3B1|nr:SDR family NAD(P)-dependent oxidoreductase [Zoogloea sp.]MDD3354704.1 SDR family NAD(P)-dependent oxidoreductase [Zoogloea sp.]
MKRSAILTGHTRGLGAALLAELQNRGFQVLGLSRNRLAEAPGLTQQSIDLASPSSLQSWLKTNALAHFLADADQAVLINNAGSLQPVAMLGQQDAQAIAAAVAVNVTAPLTLANGFLAVTAEVRDRRILHISSGAARSVYPGWSVYGATKAALDHHARAAAAERHPGVRIASLAPGVLDTDMQVEVRASDPAQFPGLSRFTILKQEGQLRAPAAAATELVTYLLSDDFGTRVDGDLRSLAV